MPLQRLTLVVAALAALFAPVALGGEAEQSLAFQLEDNLIHIPAQLNNTTVSAVLDSGTGGVVLDREIAERLHIPLTSSAQSALGAGSGAQPLFPAVLTELACGPIHLDHISGFALDLRPLRDSSGFPIDLLLGEPIFAQQAVTINYPRRRLYFGSPAPKSRKDCVPIEIVNGVPVASVTLRTKPDSAPVRLRLIVDLGTRHSAAVIGGKFLKSEEGKPLLENAKDQQVGTGTGGALMGRVVNVATLEVGSHHYHDINVTLTNGVGAFESNDVDGSLGVPLWQSAVVTFDYTHKEFYISEAE